MKGKGKSKRKEHVMRSEQKGKTVYMTQRMKNIIQTLKEKDIHVDYNNESEIKELENYKNYDYIALIYAEEFGIPEYYLEDNILKYYEYHPAYLNNDAYRMEVKVDLNTLHEVSRRKIRFTLYTEKVVNDHVAVCQYGN